MSTSQAQTIPRMSQITAASPEGHTTAVPNPPLAPTTHMPAQPATARMDPTSNALMMMTPPPTAPTQVNSSDHGATYNEQLNAADRLWKFKLALTTILIFTGIIGIGCTAWAVSTAHDWRSGYDYGYDSAWFLPWGIITFSISVIWCILCVVLFLIRKRPVQPGVRVTMDLLLWLGFLTTALFTMAALVNLLQWGEYGTLGYSSGWSSRYGRYELQDNNTWVWVQGSDDSSVTFDRVCNSSTSYTSSYNSYYTDNPFKNCTEMDAYINALWQAKPNRARTQLTGVVCQFVGLVLHFALFVWACVDCHKYRHSKVSKDAEKIAAGIVESMVQSGAIVPPPRQADTRTPLWQPVQYQLLSQSNSPAGSGQGQRYPVQGQYPIHTQQTQWQGQQQLSGQEYEQPLPPLPPQPQQAGSSNEKGVAASYYEPRR